MQNPSSRMVRYLFSHDLASAEHEHAAHLRLATRLAKLLQLPLGDEWMESDSSCGGIYFVPNHTLSCVQASACGIRCADDLFGGAVPELHMGTKVITHGLVSCGAKSPPGWRESFPLAVSDVVLHGYSVFDRGDLGRAGEELLEEGPFRAKQPSGMGGQGQQIVTSRAQLAALMNSSSAANQNLVREGLVLEENLDEVVTLSVGQIRLAGIQMSYFGTQSSTPDNDGEAAYGGSELWCVRGGFDALDTLEPDANRRLAIRQARTYHEAALRCFPSIILSRANYDVAQGQNAQGHWRSGVLEQSWRAGGASAAEIEAVSLFLQQPQRQFAHVRTVERYGEAVAPPGAIVLFHGNDSRNGPLLKYAEVIPDAT